MKHTATAQSRKSLPPPTRTQTACGSPEESKSTSGARWRWPQRAFSGTSSTAARSAPAFNGKYSTVFAPSSAPSPPDAATTPVVAVILLLLDPAPLRRVSSCLGRFFLPTGFDSSCPSMLLPLPPSEPLSWTSFPPRSAEVPELLSPSGPPPSRRLRSARKPTTPARVSPLPLWRPRPLDGPEPVSPSLPLSPPEVPSE